MEIQVAAENLVGTLAREYHLNTHRLDDTCQQIHRCRGTNGGYIVGLDIVDDITDGIEPLLNSIVDLVMNRSDMISHQLCLGEIGSTLKTDGKGVQTGPIGFGLRVILDTHLRILLGNSGNHGGVETA